MAKPTNLPVKDFRGRLADCIERAWIRGERFLVTSHGKPRAALVSLEDLAKLEQLEARPKPARRRP